MLLCKRQGTRFYKYNTGAPVFSTILVFIPFYQIPTLLFL